MATMGSADTTAATSVGGSRPQQVVLSHQQMLSVMNPEQIKNMESMNADFRAFNQEKAAQIAAEAERQAAIRQAIDSGSQATAINADGVEYSLANDLGPLGEDPT